MRLENSYSMDLEINAFGSSIIGTAKVIYEVYTDGFNYEDELKFKNVELGAAGLAHCITKEELTTLMENNVKNMMEDCGSFVFDEKEVVIQFNDDEINLITETFNRDGNIKSIINDELIMDDYEVFEKERNSLGR